MKFLNYPLTLLTESKSVRLYILKMVFTVFSTSESFPLFFSILFCYQDFSHIFFFQSLHLFLFFFIQINTKNYRAISHSYRGLRLPGVPSVYGFSQSSFNGACKSSSFSWRRVSSLSLFSSFLFLVFFFRDMILSYLFIAYFIIPFQHSLLLLGILWLI